MEQGVVKMYWHSDVFIIHKFIWLLWNAINGCQNVLTYRCVYTLIYMVVMECYASCWLESEQLKYTSCFHIIILILKEDLILK